ncbi:MAG: serine protease [Candidatus Atribacteria bacterium]|nr:serine protease [Candidatus Atribacteria bacterium]
MKNVLTGVLVGIIILFVVGLPTLCILNVPAPEVYVQIVKPKTIIDMVPVAKQGVVHIMCPEWQGSGFIISEHLIATARHVVEGVEDFEITFDSGDKVNATKAISSKDHDVAFIWVDEPMPKALVLGSIKDCKLGEQIITIGSPFGKINFNSVTLGIVSGLDRNYDELNDSMYGEQDYGWSVAFQTDSPGHPGNSGCPVFTADGIVRGILVGGLSPSLILVMPVDIFIDDIEIIEMMFRQDEYKKEVKIDVAVEAWGY